MSVFLAVDLDDVVRAKVVALIEQQRQALDAKWLRADKLHLTLVFLGNATTEHVGQFKPVIDALVHHKVLEGDGIDIIPHEPHVLEIDAAKHGGYPGLDITIRPLPKR